MSKSQFRATDFIQLISCAVIFYHCRWSLVLIAFLTAIASAEAAPIALPFTGRRASLGLDGQHVALRIDTGSASYAYVEHTVTLSIGGMTIPNFKFGLAIEFNDESGERAPFSTVDTGAASIHAELEDFNRFTEVAQRYLRRDSESGLYVVNKTDITNLPALFYGIGDLHNRAGIRIQPKHYVKCENDGNGACFVYFRYWSENACVLGRPFFHAYDVGFDLESDPPSIYLKSDDVYDEVETMV
ncbi:hypothetical protein FOL47_005612 [Perkinsus chesapeaki]|uniref:Peptidase A1 domain-containing protein n=1 Tax=Perkinsus chesapeaki TaxID=330153 RepID=A0A7J6N0N2_PERCH|nr:hypothetical protein FOL47_005612 [Perkinsus chesapeaki]